MENILQIMHFVHSRCKSKKKNQRPPCAGTIFLYMFILLIFNLLHQTADVLGIVCKKNVSLWLFFEKMIIFVAYFFYRHQIKSLIPIKITAMDEQDNTVSFFRFEDLRIYDKAMDYIVWLQKKLNTPDFTSESDFLLQKSFLKAAYGIALNTAEGSSRNKTQFLYYLKMAKSSVRECVVFTEIISTLGLLDEDGKAYSRNQLMELTKMIGSLIASLQRNSGQTHEPHPMDSDPNMDPGPDTF